MEVAHTTDFVIRLFAQESRVITLGGIAVISHGLSRNTYDADVWVDPLGSSEEWCRKIIAWLAAVPEVKVVMIGTGEPLSAEILPEIIEQYGVFRILGLERPLDIFRKPNELPVEEFPRVWERGTPLDDGTRIPDVIDLLITKQDTGRTKDTQDIMFLEAKAEEQYLAELPRAPSDKAALMLERFLTPKIAEAALLHPAEDIRQQGWKFLLGLAEDGDPFAIEMVRHHRLSES